MVGGGVCVRAAKPPSFAVRVADQLGGIAKRNSVVLGKALGAFSDQHHVGAVLKHRAGETDWIADVLQRSRGACAERRTIHHDGVAFDAAVKI